VRKTDLNTQTESVSKPRPRFPSPALSMRNEMHLQIHPIRRVEIRRAGKPLGRKSHPACVAVKHVSVQARLVHFIKNTSSVPTQPETRRTGTHLPGASQHALVPGR
jgi:hypothetical protein